MAVGKSETAPSVVVGSGHIMPGRAFHAKGESRVIEVFHVLVHQRPKQGRAGRANRGVFSISVPRSITKMRVMTIEPGAVHRQIRRAEVFGRRVFAPFGFVVSGTYCAHGLTHGKRPRRRHGLADPSRIGTLIHADAQVSWTMKHGDVAAKVRRQQAERRVFEQIRIEFRRLAHARLAGTPVMAGNRVAIVRVGREKVIKITHVHGEGDHDLLAIVQAISALGFLFALGQGRQQERGENANDGDHHQHLDQGKRVPGRLHTPGIVSGISHLISGPRTARAFLFTVTLLHKFASRFASWFSAFPLK